MAERHCEVCNVLIVTRSASKAIAAKRRFCSRACATTSRHRAKRAEMEARGYRRKNRQKGYIVVHWPGHPMASKSGAVFEHRLVMSEHLGRVLTTDEVVHHKNGVRDDNRLENLELMTRQDHLRVPTQRWKPKPCPHCGEMVLAVGRVLPVEQSSTGG